MCELAILAALRPKARKFKNTASYQHSKKDNSALSLASQRLDVSRLASVIQSSQERIIKMAI